MIDTSQDCPSYSRREIQHLSQDNGRSRYMLFPSLSKSAVFFSPTHMHIQLSAVPLAGWTGSSRLRRLLCCVTSCVAGAYINNVCFVLAVRRVEVRAEEVDDESVTVLIADHTFGDCGTIYGACQGILGGSWPGNLSMHFRGWK